MTEDQGAFRPYKNYTRTVIAGTTQFANGATTMVGTLTTYLTDLQVGDVVYDADDTFGGVVATIVNDLNATIMVNYEGAGGAAHNCVRYRVTGGNAANGYGLPSMRVFTMPALGAAPVQINIEGVTARFGTILCDRAMRLVIVEQGTNEAEVAQALLTTPYTCFGTLTAGAWSSELMQMLSTWGTDYAIYVCSDTAVAGTVSVIYNDY